MVVALNVTKVPEHTVLADAPIITLTGRFGLTTIVMGFDVAGLPVRQGDAVEVITTVMISPFARVVDVNVDPVSPEMATPPFIHL